MWRPARSDDDDRIVTLSLALHAEDPGGPRISAARVRGTLEALRREPLRGCAAVLDLEGRVEGFALLVAFLSNHLGGIVCEVDELYVAPEHRRRGHGSAIFAAIETGRVWPSAPAGIALGVSAENAAARRLYERSGFVAAGTMMVRLPR
jgi:GNAT superfamily N-acetyltransferase